MQKRHALDYLHIVGNAILSLHSPYSLAKLPILVTKWVT